MGSLCIDVFQSWFTVFNIYVICSYGKIVWKCVCVIIFRSWINSPSAWHCRIFVRPSLTTEPEDDGWVVKRGGCSWGVSVLCKRKQWAISYKRIVCNICLSRFPSLCGDDTVHWRVTRYTKDAQCEWKLCCGYCALRYRKYSCYMHYNCMLHRKNDVAPNVSDALCTNWDKTYQYVQYVIWRYITIWVRSLHFGRNAVVPCDMYTIINIYLPWIGVVALRKSMRIEYIHLGTAPSAPSLSLSLTLQNSGGCVRVLIHHETPSVHCWRRHRAIVVADVDRTVYICSVSTQWCIAHRLRTH